ITPRNDGLDDLLLHMKDTAATLLGDTPYEFVAPEDRLSESMTIEFKRNVFLAFKESITNIAKHAAPTNVEIRISFHDGRFRMAITDNGNGFDRESIRRGNGLASLAKRASTIGGTCTVTSTPGKGTSVEFCASMS